MPAAELEVKRMKVHRRTYICHGLAVASDIELPELTETESDLGSDFCIIDCGIIQSVLSPYGFAERTEGFVIWWKSVGQFVISRSGDVEFQRLPGVSDDLLRLPLVGCVLALAAYVKGRFVLHADAINVRGHGVLLMGEKGQGKSTLAAALLSRGHRLLSDDKSALSFGAAEAVLAHRGCLQLKLWPDSLATWAAASATNHRVIHANCDKRIVPGNSFASAAEHIPVSRIYSLVDGVRIATKRLSPTDSWRVIFANSYPVMFGQGCFNPSSRIPHFVNCTNLARKVGVTRLERPRRYKELADVASLIENDIEASCPGD